MKKFRFLSALLTLIMVFGVIANLSILPVFAAEEAEEEEEETIDYRNVEYATKDDKLNTMELKLSAHGYELYYQKDTGEVALKNIETDDVLFSNPYNITEAFPDGKTSSSDTKELLLSQIVVNYSDSEKQGEMYSFTEAAERDQIVVKNIKNGIRVEYTIGRQETRMLVPQLIERERFETNIMAFIRESGDAMAIRKMEAYYQLKDADDPENTERQANELKAAFPITAKMAVYVFDPYAKDRELREIEGYIKTYCPNYNYQSLQEDHALTEYEGTEDDPALFKMSLEYYLDEDGLTVRLPANGIRFNETSYSLNYIMVLPFMGAGASDYNGYTMYPDGSGTLFRFEDLSNTRIVTGQMYGLDYAYQDITTNNMETLRMPVFGVVENHTETNTYTEEQEVLDEDGNPVLDEDGNPTVEEVEIEETTKRDRGYVAIIEEGAAMANITTNHGAFVLHRYNSCYTTFYPRPKDSYNLAASISIGANAEWTVVSKRKYTGSYRIRYIMLTDKDYAEENDIEKYYQADYKGMAFAYRDYLEKTGELTRLSSEQVKADIPLYIESFGAIDIQDTFLSFPITVKTPLTTFEDVKTMYDELSAEGISNINFRLTGFSNGGMDFTVPYYVEFEDVLGGDEGYADLVAYAAEKGFGVYPDFDFMYMHSSELFDGFSFRTDAVKTIDDRYTRKRVYDLATQSLRMTGLIAISPSVLNEYYTNFSLDMSELGVSGISVATLGSDLNSDFDKKDPYNREDAKAYVLNMLEKMDADYGNIMMDGGNSYIYKYADHILNVPIDSSHHTYASEMIPFMGMVLHGYVQFAGEPTNMAGDINYEILKMIESGSNPYFTLSYQNVAELKETRDMAEYYSVSYEIWKDDLIERYNQINDALKDVQTALIVDHEFLEGERIPTEAELAADEAAKLAEEEAKAEEEAEKLAEEERVEKHEQIMEAFEAELAAKENPVEENADETVDGEAVEGEAAEGEAAEGEATEEPAAEAEPEETDEPEASEEEVEEEEEEETASKYAVTRGTIVRVTYDNGVSFILNYNSFDVTTDGNTVPAYSYVKFVD